MLKVTNPSTLPLRNLQTIQDGTLSFHYRGIPCLKNPFDLAIYTLLLWEMKPAAIIELGSAQGGSALWFASQAEAMGINTLVYSFDINPVEGVSHDKVTFGYGDIQNLSLSLSDDFLASLQRPLLVVEDGPHTYDACLSALKFFDAHLSAGDYMVIEDGIVDELGYTEYRSGPRRAIHQFLAEKPGRYEIDRRLCDYFGQNVTWNTDGYIRRVGE